MVHQIVLGALFLCTLLQACEAQTYRVLGMFPFTKNITWTQETMNIMDGLGKASIEDERAPGFSHMVSYLMAIQHFNNRDTSVVPELNYYSSCNVQLDTTHMRVLDTQSSSSAAVAMIMKLVWEQQKPDVVIGGYYEQPVNDLSVATSGLRVPYVPYGSARQQIITPFVHPFSTRLSASHAEMAQHVYRYLQCRERTNYISILHSTSTAGTQLGSEITVQLKQEGLSSFTKPYMPPLLGGSAQGIQDGVNAVKARGYRTIVLVVDAPEEGLRLIAEAVDQAKMNGPEGYFWVIVGTMNLSYFQNSALTSDDATVKLLQGAVVISSLDGFMHNKDNDLFLKSWKRQGVAMASLVNDYNPMPPDAPGYQVVDASYFQNTLPDQGSSFVYDAVMATGMGLCVSENEREWVNGIRSADFTGASGHVAFGSNALYPGGRSTGSITFGAFNLLQPNSTEPYTLTDMLPTSDDPSQSWETVAPFVFADGTTNSPALLRDTPEQNYISLGFRVAGFCLWGIALTLIFLSFIWICCYRKSTVVKASQPFFLVIIIFGCLIQSFAIFTNSWDESHGWSDEQLAVACTATPWLIVLGILLVYSSIFTKLWRINKVLSFRRTTVKIQQVIAPAVLLILAAIFLLTIWTLVEGFEWVRIELDPDSGESLGKCQGQHSMAFFTPIFILVMIPILLTFYMAYKTGDVDSSYSESNWIYVLILLQLELVLVSIPVLSILEAESTNGRYIGQIMIIFTFSITPILLIIAPKVWLVHFKKAKRKSVRGQRSESGVKVSGLHFSTTKNPWHEEFTPPRRKSSTSTHSDRSASFRPPDNLVADGIIVSSRERLGSRKVSFGDSSNDDRKFEM